MPELKRNEEVTSPANSKKQWVKPEIRHMKAGSAENNPNPSFDFNEFGFS